MLTKLNITITWERLPGNREGVWPDLEEMPSKNQVDFLICWLNRGFTAFGLVLPGSSTRSAGPGTSCFPVEARRQDHFLSCIGILIKANEKEHVNWHEKDHKKDPLKLMQKTMKKTMKKGDVLW